MEDVLIVADDLTGAADTGVHFAGSGIGPVVISTHKATRLNYDFGILIVNTATRGKSESDVERTLLKLSPRLQTDGLIYKKIDSTLRGSIGLELETLMEVVGRRTAVIAPAFPELGRVLIGGQLYVDGAPLLSTDFSNDPECPFTADLPRLLKAQTTGLVGYIALGDVRRGSEHLARRLTEIDTNIVVVDAEKDQDLRDLARACLMKPGHAILSGSGGFAKAIAHELQVDVGLRPPLEASQCDRVLVVAGSRREITLDQVERLHTLDRCLHGGLSHRKENGQLVLEYPNYNWESHPPDILVLSTNKLPVLAGREGEIRAQLARHAAELVKSYKPDAVLLTGGEVAQSVCQALGVNTIEIIRELLPGLPLCSVMGGAHADLPLVTKAGGFGSRDTLRKAVLLMRGERNA